MKRTTRDPVRIDMLDLLARYAAQRNLPIRDGKTTAEFLEDIRRSSLERMENEAYLHGKRTEAMFEMVVASLGEVQLLKQEDVGLYYNTGEDLKLPDLRVVTKEGEQLLIEIKNHRVDEFQPLRQKCEYLDKLSRYATLTRGELLIAIYWSSMNQWSLVPVSAFVRSGQNATLTMEQAFLWNQMIRLGDRLICTRAPLCLRMKVHEESTDPEILADGGRNVRIMHVDVLSEGRVLTNPTEQRLATFLLMEGGWQESTTVIRTTSGEYEAFEFVMAPELQDGHPLNEGGFEYVGMLSSMLSHQFQRSTTTEGTLSAIRVQFEPGEIRRLLPDDYPFGKGSLPLWVMSVLPKNGLG